MLIFNYKMNVCVISTLSPWTWGVKWPSCPWSGFWSVTLSSCARFCLTCMLTSFYFYEKKKFFFLDVFFLVRTNSKTCGHNRLLSSKCVIPNHDFFWFKSIKVVKLIRPNTINHYCEVSMGMARRLGPRLERCLDTLMNMV